MTDDNIPFGWKRSAAAGLTFRRITDDDTQFLARVYASTRAGEMSAVATMTEALDVVRAFAPAMMLADVGAAQPKPERFSEAARQAGSIPLVMMGARETHALTEMLK